MKSCARLLASFAPSTLLGPSGLSGAQASIPHLYRTPSDSTVIESHRAVTQAGVRIPRGLERPHIVDHCGPGTGLFPLLLLEACELCEGSRPL